MPVMELPRPNEEPEDNAGTGLISNTNHGTNEGMEAEDTKAYTVEDEFRISWLDNKMRGMQQYGGVRDCIVDGMLLEPATDHIKQYMNYLVYDEHGVDTTDNLGETFAVQANFGKDSLYCTYKVVV